MGRNLGDHVVLVSRAAGATRLIASPDGGRLFAEIAGAWQAESFRNDDLPPPVLRLVDVASDSVVATTQGWALTPPGAGGSLYLAPGPDELTYRVQRLGAGLDVALAPPDGVWAVKAAVPAPAAGRGVVVLWRPIAGTWAEVSTRREELWLASIAADTGAVGATRTLQLAGRSIPRGMLTVGAGVAADPIDGTIYLASLAPGGVTVDALDATTLATRWSRPLAVPPGGLAAATGSPAAAIGVTGDGAAIVVVVGDNQAAGVRPDAAYVLDRGGAVVKTIDAPALQPYWDVAALSPAGPGQVLGHSVLETRNRSTRRFIGLFALEPAGGELSLRFDPSSTPRTRELRALASTFDAAGKRALVAPESFEDVRNLGIDVGISAGTGTGVEREEVRGAVTIPPGWYADGRPRYDAWRAQFR